jgi:hypothetical protein
MIARIGEREVNDCGFIKTAFDNKNKTKKIC